MTKGGPSGGNGGRGGDVILQADHDLNNLINQYYVPRLIAKNGDAGMGKSRLAGEFLATLSAEPAARVTCLPYGRAITYWPLQELIRGEAGISPTDPLDEARAKIEKRVSELAGFDEQERRAVVRELTALALAGPDGEPSDLTSELRRRELALGMTRYLEARLGSTPGTIVLEDLHWAEEPLLALLEELLEHLRAPLLLVCLARTDLLARRQVDLRMRPSTRARSVRHRTGSRGHRGWPRLRP